MMGLREYMICKECLNPFENVAWDSEGEEWHGTRPSKFPVSPCCGSGYWRNKNEMNEELCGDESAQYRS